MSSKTERLLRLYNRLRRGPLTIDIAYKWAKSVGIEVSDRQLYRDLNELKSLSVEEGENVVEYTDEKNHKTWKLEYERKGETLTPYDINGYFLLKNFIPASIERQRRSTFEKLERILYQQLSKSKYQQLIEANELYLRRTDFFDIRYTELEHQQIEDLLWALQNKRILIVHSYCLNPANIKANALPLYFCPLELLFHRGRVYVAGLSRSNSQLLIFTLEKGFHFEPTNERFDRKKLLPPYREQTGKMFGVSLPIDGKKYRIKVEFTKEFAESMMHFYWHDSQQWHPLKNGNYMLQLHCSIGRELVGFLAHGLDKIKVHEPKTLKQLLVKKMKQAVHIHEANGIVDEALANQDY